MKYKPLVLLGFGILIIAVMMYFIGIDEIIDAVKIANLTYILLAIIVQFITFYLFALRWKIINKIADINISVKNLIPIVLIGMAVNNITPSGRGGGEPVKAYILSKKIDKPFELTFATVIADRALDSLPFLVLAILTIILMIVTFNVSQWILSLLILGVIVVIAAFILLIYMSINKKAAEKIVTFVLKIVRIFYKKNEGKLEKKILGAIEGFQDTMNIMLRDKSVLYKGIPLSFIIWITEILRVYLIFIAFGASASPILIAEVFIVSTLLGMIPLLPGGLGVVDGVMILLFSSGGISPQISAAATVLERLISFWMTSIIGLLLLPYYGYSITEKMSISSFTEDPQIFDELPHKAEVIEEIFEKEKEK